MNRETPRFRITITNNETGETIRDTDTRAIIGACDLEGDATGTAVQTACNGIELAATATGAIMAAKRALKGDHKAKRLVLRFLIKSFFRKGE